MTATLDHLYRKLLVAEADWERGWPYPSEQQIADELVVSVTRLRALADDLDERGILEERVDGEPPRLLPGKVWPHRGPVFRTRREQAET